jgi:uncharacterized phiE125 gp8 family phage protein
MGYKLIAAPTIEPISLTEIKRDLRIDHADADDSLTRMMAEAREFLETRLQSKFLTQTWEFIIDAFPIAEIRLPFGPVQSIVSVKYDDTVGIEQTIAATDYYLDDVSFRVAPEPWLFPTEAWPATLDAINAVRIQFVCGYTAGNLVPGPIRSAFRLKVRELYDGDDTRAQVDAITGNVQIMVA